jgi:1,3-beta-glucan synthase
MSGHPQGGHYDDGYGPTQGQHPQQGQDAYYQDEQYGQYHDDARAPQAQGQGQAQYQQHGQDAYYDESCVFHLSHCLQIIVLIPAQSLL